MIPYQHLYATPELYKQNQFELEGFVLTELVYMYLTAERENFPIPTFLLQLSNKEFQISQYNRNLNFSRVYIDFISSHNNFLGFKQVLREQEFPHTVSIPQITDQIYEELLDEHTKLWRDGIIDLSLTRFSNFRDNSTNQETPHIFLFPSPDSVVQQIEQAINELSAIKIAKSRIAIGHVTIWDPDALKQNINEWELQQMLLHKSLLEFSVK